MFIVKDKVVVGMAMLRVLSSLIEFSAAMLMLRFNRVESALKINAVLAFVGPVVLLTVMTLGLFGMAGKVPSGKLVTIIIGVAIIFYGINRR